jgi:hypothetical protein
VNDFMVHVDRRPVGFQRQLHNVYRANHSGAKASRPYPQQHFSVGFRIHLTPYRSALLAQRAGYQNSIITYPVSRLHRFSFRFLCRNLFTAKGLAATGSREQEYPQRKCGRLDLADFLPDTVLLRVSRLSPSFLTVITKWPQNRYSTTQLEYTAVSIFAGVRVGYGRTTIARLTNIHFPESRG